jgi:hypothetical protein
LHTAANVRAASSSGFTNDSGRVWSWITFKPQP